MSGYRGRFAPTPSGPLHLGSLCTALASWLDARAAGGCWLLRIDDLDASRCRPEHTSEILRQLEAHGLTWDESPRLVRRHIAEYRVALDQLRREQRVYYCRCTRARLADTQIEGPDGRVYPGTCRRKNLASGALRVRVTSSPLHLDDPLLGSLRRAPVPDIGDFVVWRSDDLPGYQLHCTVDEVAQRITHVVRGADLLGSTFRQRDLAAQLALPCPKHVHLPVVVDAAGRKLSKQNHARPVTTSNPGDNLRQALALLGQPAPRSSSDDPRELLALALASWDLARVGRVPGGTRHAATTVGLQATDLASSA